MKRSVTLLVIIVVAAGIGLSLEGTLCRPASAISGGAAIERLVADATVGEPSRVANLALFPVRLRRILDDTSYVTLDEAMKQGFLEITEMASAEVNRVRVRNTTNETVFLLSGEIISGAKQDRMVEDDILLPPHSGEIALGVYCTEHGRWSGASSSFGSGAVSVHNRLRQVAKQSRSQAEVWAEVETKASSLSVAAPPPTGAARRIYSQSEVQSRLKPYLEDLSDLPGRYRDVCGVVAAAGGEILVADVFCNPDLFRKLWPKLLQSYALDAVDRADPTCSVSRDDAWRYLRRAARAAAVARPTPGVGSVYDLRGDRVSGSALVYRGVVTHLDLFPRVAYAQPRPPRVPNLEFRRQRR